MARNARKAWPRGGPLLVFAALSGAALGCADHAARRGPAASPPPAEPRAPSSAPAPVSALPASGFRDVVLSRHSLTIALPDAARWQPMEPREKWWAVRHPGSRSELRVRAWTAPRRVSPAECERQARSWRPEIPVASPETVVEAHRLDAPRGFDTRVVVGVQALAPTLLEGYALAFGAGVGRCYAAIYETRAEGASAERDVADRLAVVVDGIFASVRLRSVDDRGPGPQPIR